MFKKLLLTTTLSVFTFSAVHAMDNEYYVQPPAEHACFYNRLGKEFVRHSSNVLKPSMSIHEQGQILGAFNEFEDDGTIISIAKHGRAFFPSKMETPQRIEVINSLKAYQNSGMVPNDSFESLARNFPSLIMTEDDWNPASNLTYTAWRVSLAGHLQGYEAVEIDAFAMAGFFPKSKEQERYRPELLKKLGELGKGKTLTLAKHAENLFSDGMMSSWDRFTLIDSIKGLSVAHIKAFAKAAPGLFQDEEGTPQMVPFISKMFQVFSTLDK